MHAAMESEAAATVGSARGACLTRLLGAACTEGANLAHRSRPIGLVAAAGASHAQVLCMLRLHFAGRWLLLCRCIWWPALVRVGVAPQRLAAQPKGLAVCRGGGIDAQQGGSTDLHVNESLQRL